MSQKTLKCVTKDVKMSNYMADEILDDVLPEEEETSSSSTTEKPEPQVPLSRLREEVEKRKKLEAEVNKPKQQEVPVEEQKVREILSKITSEKIEQEKQDALQLRKELDDLHVIYGDFDENQLQKIVDRYGCYDDENKVKWTAAMELYEKIGEVPEEAPKPKLPSQKRAGDATQEVVTTPDVSKKDMHSLVQEGLKKFGL